jgi:hypothetical protein
MAPNSALTRSVTMTFFLMLKSTFQKGLAAEFAGTAIHVGSVFESTEVAGIRRAEALAAPVR